MQPPQDAGGDTLWASGYEAYDRLSPAWQKLAEGLTATHYQVRQITFDTIRSTTNLIILGLACL